MKDFDGRKLKIGDRVAYKLGSDSWKSSFRTGLIIKQVGEKSIRMQRYINSRPGELSKTAFDTKRTHNVIKIKKRWT